VSRPLVVDLFCGEGGAAKGYADAGFDVVGVDLDARALRRYPFPAITADWRTGLDYWLAVRRVDLIHASPPCQHYSVLGSTYNRAKYPDLVGPVREALIATGKPYVIENVPGAPLINPVMLCGSMFGRVTDWPGKGKVGLKRHRLFESTFPVASPGPCSCRELLNVPVYGHGAGGNRQKLRGRGCANAAREVMGIDWMTRDGLDQAIPPVFTEYIGNQAMSRIHTRDRYELAA
jgi:DNA (cytosine-5)-methyltransferase 1